MTTRDLSGLIAETPLFKGLSQPVLATIAGCARNSKLPAGHMLGREGELQNEFFLVREGKVAIQTMVPAKGVLTLQTLGPGNVVGWSWIFPPYLWEFDARVLTDTLALVFDGACLRRKCDADHSLGYDLMRRMAAVMTARLKATRLQLMDLYGPHGTSSPNVSTP